MRPLPLLYVRPHGIVSACAEPILDVDGGSYEQGYGGCRQLHRAWNERDSSRRRELLAKTWTENGSYIDPHRGGTGYEQLTAMIQTVHDAFPPVYRFRLASRVDEYGDRVRFQWEAGGTKDAPLHFVGTDFAVLSEDGRFQSVTGFVDESPQTPAVKAAS